MSSTQRSDTHGLIVQSALELFASNGYAGASMREIATKVGVQPASLYSHFPSKEDVLWHVCQWTAAASTELMDTVDELDLTALERYVVFFHTFVVFHAVNQRETMVMATQWRSLSRERRAFAARHRHLYASRAQGYVEAIAGEQLVNVPDVELATRALLDLNIGVATWYRAGTDPAPEDLADDYVRLTLGMLRFRETETRMATVERTLKRLRTELALRADRMVSTSA